MRSVTFASVVLSLVVTILLGTTVAAQDATPGATPVAAPGATPATGGPAEVLFVQSFTTGSLEPGAEPGAAILTLLGLVGETVYFSDRPERSAGTIANAQFLELLAQDTADPLNAALVIDRPEGDAVVVVELLDGTVDAAGTVTYDVLVLTDTDAFSTDMTGTAELLTELTGAMDFGSSHLFVDGACTNFGSC